jgi:hypothetical protein
LVERPRNARELIPKTRTLGIPTARTIKKHIEDKGGKK